MNAAQGKYLRYILFAILGLAIIHFITSSSLPIPKAGDLGLSYPRPGQQTSSSPTEEEKPPKQDASNPVTPPTPPAGNAPGPGYEKVNATFVTLARNSDLWEIAKSIRQVEDRFNKDYHYDWVFLNDAEFSDEFKKFTTRLVSGKTHYGLIPKEHWSYPSWIDQNKAAEVRKTMKQKEIIYGDSESYRHMCRYESGFFFRHELMMQYDYYWRVEPSIEYFCDIHIDPFKFMKDNNKKYSFVISLPEYPGTIETLWQSTKKFIAQYPEHIAKNNNLEFISADGGKTYNNCHFWSNFEVGDLNFFRSQKYLDFFNLLDQDGGFFYERWGDAPVHSIAVSLMLNKDEIHFFNDIAYRHVPFVHCPTGEQTRLDLKCHCNPGDNFTWKSYSCTSRFFDTNKMSKPTGWEAESH
ncbi:alpha-1,2 mannosyltransferase KTR1 [Nannizzia gypsea CBS 118893]|uniref:Alpha-1,2 mannosyltransferase KTR1 n=1 Tax=Arthroderma gypseum (strain ATCC MYA-4604 / CBS 118893) TaxID=535722 RepID=E4URB1_ARTGP|nr:alpha-1,2 mannosyltransferase KTR1 [Nannizzia gypsea CBS 118893]EFR00174.1 alpha-1,2 mannosyltransferase KTR1 [Nannizzia gypsea CBS 118893]